MFAIFIYKENSFGVRVTPNITLHRVFYSVCSKWKDLTPCIVGFSYVRDAKRNNIYTDSNLQADVCLSLFKREESLVIDVLSK